MIIMDVILKKMKNNIYADYEGRNNVDDQKIKIKLFLFHIISPKQLRHVAPSSRAMAKKNSTSDNSFSVYPAPFVVPPQHSFHVIFCEYAFLHLLFAILLSQHTPAEMMSKKRDSF